VTARARHSTADETARDEATEDAGERFAPPDRTQARSVLASTARSARPRPRSFAGTPGRAELGGENKEDVSSPTFTIVQRIRRRSLGSITSISTSRARARSDDIRPRRFIDGGGVVASSGMLAGAAVPDECVEVFPRRIDDDRRSIRRRAVTSV